MLKICIICSFIGVLGIVVFSPKEPVAYAIADLSDTYIGNNVVIEGSIESLYTNDAGHNFLTVSDGTGSISVVAFKGTGLDGAEKGSKIKAAGRLQTYKQQTEIIAENITVLP